MIEIMWLYSATKAINIVLPINWTIFPVRGHRYNRNIYISSVY